MSSKNPNDDDQKALNFRKSATRAKERPQMYYVWRGDGSAKPLRGASLAAKKRMWGIGAKFYYEGSSEEEKETPKSTGVSAGEGSSVDVVGTKPGLNVEKGGDESSAAVVAVPEPLAVDVDAGFVDALSTSARVMDLPDMNVPALPDMIDVPAPELSNDNEAPFRGCKRVKSGFS